MATSIENCTAVILAGGENRRMPVSKAFITVQGRKIIDRNIRLLRSLFQECMIVTNQPEQYLYLNTPLFGDIHDIRSPMSGIVTALANAKTDWIFVTACDMPFLDKETILRLACQRTRAGTEAVAPLAPKGPEPLHAFYSSALLTSLERQLLRGTRSMKDFLRNKRVQYITITREKDTVGGPDIFTNLNTPDDIYSYLNQEDSMQFRKALERRRKCSV